jgi:hypothetical protein
MMDVDNHTIWCYEYLPATRKLKLVAARSFDYDRYLTDHENDEPTAQQVRELVERQHQIKNRIQKKTPTPTIDGFGDKGGSRNGPHSKDSTKAPHKAAPEEEDSLGTSVPGIYEPETTQDDDN